MERYKKNSGLASDHRAFDHPFHEYKMEPTNPNASTYSKTNAQTFFGTLVGDTLVEPFCGTLSCDTFVTLWDTLAGHSRRKLLWDTLVDSCATVLRDTLVGHSRTQM